MSLIWLAEEFATIVADAASSLMVLTGAGLD
jgi:hypothetical protein